MYYLITGATCSGKDTIAKFMTETFAGFKTLVSTTSRPIRPKEEEGVDYHFISSEEFKKILDEDGFIEHRKYETTVNGIKDTWYYGLEKSSVADNSIDYVVVIDYQGAMEFQNYVGKQNTIIIYVRSTYEDRYVRNLLRGDFNLQEWIRRNIEDAGWLAKSYRAANFIVENYGYDCPVNPNEKNSQTYPLEYGYREIDISVSDRKFTLANTKKDICKILVDVSTGCRWAR